jgi:hypothetical protein
MIEITFSQLEEAIPQPDHRAGGNKIRVREMPQPFVAPAFDLDEGDAARLNEIVLIRASAAVGKTTIAHALSARRNIPVLDLSETAVATGSLKGILGDLTNGSNPLEAFHAGKLPLIIDALDEGRLLSNDKGFFSFLETSAETVLESRSVTDRPKLILLGRPEAIDYAEIVFSDGGLKISRLEVGFFDEQGARALIHAYAQNSAKPESLYHVHREPAEQLINAYFDKIEEALGLAPGKLWDSPTGRGFAGYAPVLAAIGSLLPEIENFKEALNRFDETGAQSAWGVIESVLSQIIDRDRAKLVQQLEGQLTGALPSEAYDLQEQLALLLQYVERQPLTGTGRIRPSPSDLAKYESQVAQWLPEHPFLRGRSFSNDVIASYVLANAVSVGRHIGNRSLLSSLSRQPFLWRSLGSILTGESLIEGGYLGFILSSLWSDPLTKDTKVFIYDASDGSSVVIRIEGNAMTPSTEPIEFTATTPLSFFGELRNVEVEIEDQVTLEGIGDAPSTTFFFHESVSVITKLLKVEASRLQIDGTCWLDPQTIDAMGQLSLDIRRDAKFGWGSPLKETYPFSKHPANMEEPRPTGDGGTLESLLDECARRLTAGAALALNPDFSAPQNDVYTRWTRRHYAQEFPILVSLMVEYGLAATEPMPASGTGKVRVRLQTNMTAIRDAVVSGTSPPEVSDFISALKAAIP